MAPSMRDIIECATTDNVYLPVYVVQTPENSVTVRPPTHTPRLSLLM